MKTTIKYATLLCAAIAVLLAGCKKSQIEKDLNSGYNENAKVEEMTPDEQKDYLLEVGKEIIATFNPEDQRNAVELAEGLYNKYQLWDWEVIGEQMEEEFNKIDAQGFFRMPSRIAALVTGETTTLDTKELLVSFAVVGRLFEFDDKTQTMKVSETKDGSIIARFKDAKGTDCELKVWGEGNNTTVTFTYAEYRWEDEFDEYGNYIGSNKIYEGTRVIKAEVPEEIHMYLKQGSTTIMAMDFTWKSNFKDFINHSLSLKVTNIAWNQELNVSTTEASAVFSLLYGDKKLVVAALDLPKYKLIDWNGGKDITLDEGESWIEQYDAQYEAILGSLGKGEGVVDIIGKVRGKMSITDGAGFYDAIKGWNNKDYANDLEEDKAYCDIFNNYIHIGVYYGGNTEQAQVKMQPTYYSNDYGEGYYNSVPVLYFPKDETTYEVMSFFEETKFNVLIDLVEDLVNAYKDLDKEHLLFEDGRIELN